MANLRRRLRVVFCTPISRLLSDPRNELREIILDLIRLKRSLRGLGQPPQHPLSEPLYEIEDFFARVSWWHDRGLEDVVVAFAAVNYGQWDETIRRLEALGLHFIRAGRSPYGMNPTERGETVTAEKVFLGGVYSLFTHPVPYWVRQRMEPKGIHPDFPDMNAYDLVLDQARRFMRSHAEPMIRLITELEEVCEGRDRRAA